MVHWYPKYVPVGVRRARASVEMNELRERGLQPQPVEVRGRNIAGSFWGRRWCEHLESFSDYANRLPRGRTYVRNGSVCHLAVEPGGVEAMVAGRELYRVVVRVKRLKQPTWKAIKKACAGQIGSVLELLQGRLSDRVMDIVAHRDTGLFPQPGEIKLACDCPDWATMCKHAAAVLYGVGSRLDNSPELLFRLRGVDEAELIAADMALPRGKATADTLADGDLGDIFGIDLDSAGGAPAPNARQPAAVAVRAVAEGEPARKPAVVAVGESAPSAGARKPAPAPNAGKLASGAGRAAASGAPARKPAVAAVVAGGASAPNAWKPAAKAIPPETAAAPSPRAPTPPRAASRQEKSKKAPPRRAPRADRSPAPPRPEDNGAAASRPGLTGAEIAGLRAGGGFTVAEFARLLEVSGTTVRRWEAAPGPLGLHARTREALDVLRLELQKLQE